MEKVTVLYNGKSYPVDKGTKVKDFFGLGGDYDSNPIVGVLLNGEFKGLDYSLVYKTTRLEPVRLFSPLGKRIYRHSLCFLLSYAASVLYPDRHLEIGHSLGDGFYFRFTDAAVTEADISALSDLMHRTAEADLPVTKEKIPYLEALEVFNKRTSRHTKELLESRNDGDITVYSLDGYTDSAYEPLLPSTGLLRVWDLRTYGGGLLLRYPQSRDFSRIHDFEDNPLLYSVFRQTAQDNRILECESLGQLNSIILSGRTGTLIQQSECMFNNRIARIADDIRSRDSVRIVYIAGPSSSGKTTFSLKLGLQLKTLGFRPVKISLDDYYFSREKVPLDSDGNRDYEALEALDLDFFRENLDDLVRKGRCRLPHFSFRENRRYMADEYTVMDDSTVLLVEGIHGLNPALAPDVGASLTYKVYISALTGMIIDDHNRISTTDNRIIRRIVRDFRTRGVRTEETLIMWPSVERGEKTHIFPYQNNADAMINSAMPYEFAALAPQALNLLRSVKPDAEYAFATARRLLKFLELFYTIPMDMIPSDSITREFLGGSVFGAI